MNLYAYAGNNPVAFTDPFGLCAAGGPDSVQVPVTVVCPNGTSEKQTLWAHRVDAADLPSLTNAAAGLKGGSPVFTPAGVQTAYGMLVNGGNVYTFAPQTADGGIVADGAVTVTGGGGFTAFSQDVWNNIRSGSLRATVGNLGITTCTVVGHEGVHLLQSMGSGAGANPSATKRQRENEALGVTWHC